MGIEKAKALYRNHISNHVNISETGIEKDDKKAFYDAFDHIDFENQQKIVRDLREHLKFYGGDIAGPLFFLVVTIIDFIEANRHKFDDSGLWMEKLLKSQLVICEVLFLYWQSIIIPSPQISQNSFLLKRLRPIPEFFFFDLSKMKDVPEQYVEVFPLKN